MYNILAVNCLYILYLRVSIMRGSTECSPLRVHRPVETVVEKTEVQT